MIDTVNILPAGMKKQLTAIKQLTRDAQSTTGKLASGKDVNSILDNPLNFVTSQALSFQAADISLLLDGIGQSIRTIQEASNGVAALISLVDQAEALVIDSLRELFPSTNETPDQRAIDFIRSRNPEKAYLDGVGNFYQNTSEFVPWATARANAANSVVNGVPEVTGHLATITSAEENAVIAGMLTSSSWLGGSDEDVEGVWRWTDGPEAGQQFWQGLAAGSPVDGAYTNWAPNEPNQFFGPASPENAAHMRADGRWNDLPGNRNLNYIIEWGGQAFIENPDVNVSADAMDYRDRYLDILAQIERLSFDAQYRGIRLLQNDNLQTIFNIEGTSRLSTEGIDATKDGLGLVNDNFISKTELTKSLNELRAARNTLRGFGTTLQVELGVVSTRLDYSREAINTLKSGSDDLTVADQNELGAELLAIQTRQQIQFQTLSLASQNNARVANTLFG